MEANEGQVTKNSGTLKKFGKIGLGVLLFLILISALVSGDEGSTSADTDTKDSATPTERVQQAEKKEAVEEKKLDVPREYKSALAQAKSYSNTMHMSKQGVYDQLVSEYGGQFTAEAAQYAIDNVESDWNANALEKAKTYQTSMNMSPAAIRDQLVSAYGEKFTEAEADYAIANLN